GFRDGSRVRRPGRARVRSSDGLRPVRGGFRRGDAAVSSLTGGVTDRSAGDIPEIGVGMLGYAFMGKAHSNAFRKIVYMTWPPPLRPRLVAIAGRNEDAVSDAATRYGFERWTAEWQDMVSDPGI